MKKNQIATALALALGTSVSSKAATTITITQMIFSGVTYNATGNVNDAGNGAMSSLDLFNGFHWTATQQNWFDTHSGTLAWTDSDQANYVVGNATFNYTFSLTGNQVAAGTWFTWNTNYNIPVLTIYTCDSPPNPATCVGESLPMAAGPFPGSAPEFDGTTANIGPDAVDDTKSMALSDVTLTFDPRTNDTDLEDGTPSGAVTAGTAVSGTAGGNIVINPDNTITYTPAMVGVDTFGYFVADSSGQVSSKEATVSVTVSAAANNVPVTHDVPTGLSTNEDTTLNTITLPNIAIAEDADGSDVLQYNTVSQGANGLVAITTTTTTNDTIAYTPNLDFNGTDSFTFTVTDTKDVSNTSTMTVEVFPVQDPMSCSDVDKTTLVDAPFDVTNAELVGACTDPDGAVTLVSFSQPSHGVVTGTPGGTLTYTPTTGYEGIDSFTFTASDGAGGDTVYTVNVTVVSDPSLHIVAKGNFTMIDGGGGLMNGGATVVNGVFDERLICDAVTCTNLAFTTPLSSSQDFFSNPWTAHDIRVFKPGTYVFDTDCSGADIAAGTTNCPQTDGVEGPNFTFTIGPNQLGSHILFDWNANLDIDVYVLWDYNVAFGDPIYNGCGSGDPGGGTRDCDLTHTATKLWNWSSIDVDGDGFRGFAMVDGPFPGSHANFNLDFTPGYTPPVANDDNKGAKPTIMTVLNVLANDVDKEQGAPPTGVFTVTMPAASAQGGTLVNNNDGTVDYTPPGALVLGDTDSFQYTLTDEGGAVSLPATVNITITNNNPPVANNVTFVTNEDTGLTINVTDSDSIGTDVGTDVDLNPLTFATFDALSANGATVTVDPGRTMLTYTPVLNFFGPDSFNFSLNDGTEDSNVATMSMTINSVNDAVVCNDVSLGTEADTALTVNVNTDLLAGCSDIEGDAITFVSVSQPANGVTKQVNASTLSYTPASGFEGDDSFTFTATDGNGGNATATVNVMVGTPLGNFTMLDSSGNVFGGTNDIFVTWDQTTFNIDESDTNFGLFTIQSVKPQPFFNFFWSAHHIPLYGPGSYSFDTGCSVAQYDSGVTKCGGSNPIKMTVGPGQIGAHILFDWGKPTTGTPCGVANCDIDVVNVWDQNTAWDRLGHTSTANKLFLGPAGVAPDEAVSWLLVSTDVNGDTFNGSPMVDGPFQGFYANFNAASILPPGSLPGEGSNVVLDPVPHEQQDTELGDGKLPTLSLNIPGLFLIMLTLLGLRNKRTK